MSFHLSLSVDTVASAYPDEPLFVSPESTVGEVLQLLRAQSGSSVLICDATRLLGIFTERDALSCMANLACSASEDTNGGVLKSSVLKKSITEVMTASPATVGSSATVGEAIEKMSKGGYRNLPIAAASETSSGMPSGLTTVHGLVHYLVDHFPSTIYNLPPKPGCSPSEREGA